MTRRILHLAIVGAALCVRSAGAQQCTADSSVTSLSSFAGQRIAAVDIVTMDPVPLPGPAAIIDGIHVTTRESTIARQLLFAPGDTVDTALIAESLRALRRHRYLADVRISGRRCEGDRAVTVTVLTRDDWSTQPVAKMQSTGGSIGIDERNLMGTGREASAYLSSSRGRLGLGFGLADPFLSIRGSEVALNTSYDRYRDGSTAQIVVANRQRSVFDDWRVEGQLRRSTRGRIGDPVDVIRRDVAGLLIGRAVQSGPSGVTSLLGGVEGERTRVISAPDAALVGPAAVRRNFAGIDAGLRRETASYDTLTWLLPQHALVDVPLGFEGEAVVGMGRDWARGQPAVHFDAWGGRAWMTGKQLALAGLWSSGYWGDDRLDAATVRASFSLFRSAARGLWIAQLAGERLLNPDPDLHALSESDQTLAAFPAEARLAAAAVNGSLERDVRVRGISHSWALDGALFGAGSARWDPAMATPDRLYVGVVGVGIRLAPLRQSRGTFRLDLALPVVHSPGIASRPYLAISVLPWLGASRERDGRRDR